jgi:hypothetical protein
MGEQLVKEVVTELMDDLVKNVTVPDVRHNGALVGEVSSSSAPEAGAWESVHPGLVNVHQNNCQEHGCWSRGE